MLELVRHPVAYFVAMIAVFLSGWIPPSPTTLMAAKANPPLLLAALAAVAGAIAACVDWVLCRRVFRIGLLERARAHPLFDRAERAAKVAPFLTTFTFAALPLPFVIVRVLMPLTGYPLWRYAGAVALGRLPRIFVIASFGKVFDVPTWILEVAFVAGVVAAAIAALARKLGWIGARPPSPEAPKPAGPGGMGDPPPTSSASS